jgi:hypothetical protein
LEEGGRRGKFLVCTYPTIFLCLLPTLAVLAHADDDVQAIVARIEALPVALRPVPDDGERVILEVSLQLGERPVAALVHDLLGASKVERLDSADGLLQSKEKTDRGTGVRGCKLQKCWEREGTSKDVVALRDALVRAAERDASSE